MYFRWRFEANPARKKRLEQTILLLYQKNLDSVLEIDKILLPPPNPEAAKGEFELGTVIYDNRPVAPFGLRDKEFLRHVGISGITGTGKSNVVFGLIDSLINRGKKVFVFDWKKQYRDYLSLRPNADVLIFGVGNKNVPTFQFNPLIPPPGIEPFQYLEHVCQIVASSYYCGEGVISLLRKTISELYEEFGVYTGTPERYPTFSDVLERVENIEKRGRGRDWQESTLRSLEAICHGGIGQIVNVDSPTLKLSELLEQNVILELGDLGESQKMFIIQSLLFYIYFYTMNRGIKEKFLNAIIIEEAHHILREHSKAAKEPITDIILKEIREFSTGLIIVDQNPSLISVPALANNYTTIGMYTKHGSDISALSRAMFLDEKQKEFLGRLECGHGIVKLAGRIFDPFLVRFPLVRVKKGSVTDNLVAEHMGRRGYFRYSMAKCVVKAESENNRGYFTSDKRSPVKGGICERPGNSVRTPLPTPNPLADIMTALVRDIDDHPFDGITARTKRLRISPRKCNNAIEEMVERGIVEKTEIREKKGRRILVDLTSDARIEMIARGARLRSLDPQKHGGVEHRY